MTDGYSSARGPGAGPRGGWCGGADDGAEDGSGAPVVGASTRAAVQGHSGSPYEAIDGGSGGAKIRGDVASARRAK